MSGARLALYTPVKDPLLELSTDSFDLTSHQKLRPDLSGHKEMRVFRSRVDRIEQTIQGPFFSASRAFNNNASKAPPHD
jgi:hypothetical protein